MTRPLVHALLFCCCSVPLAAAQDKKTLDDNLQGTWAVAKAERNGESFDALRDDSVTFEKGKLTITTKKGTKISTQQGAYQLDAAKTPAQITFFPSDANELPIEGIVKIETVSDKPQLVLFLARPGKDNRPKAFDPKDKKDLLGTIKITLKRATDK